jgi:N-acetylneuraminic acid mutarotase
VGQFQQFEVWHMKDGKWEFVASFVDFDTAYAVTKNRSNQVRLLKVTYKDGHAVEQEIIAELGQIRGQP